MAVVIKVDITTGDIITPKEIDFEYMPMFSGEPILIKSYNLETLLAEKLETIISRSIQNTRPRDYYDVYILEKLYATRIDYALLSRALLGTSRKRGSINAVMNYRAVLAEIADDVAMNQRWNGYSREYSYANRIEFSHTIESVYQLLDASIGSLGV
jgi:hypothetical protein